MAIPGTLTARGSATRQRIVEAATAEFAEHGIAGARIERVVAAARTNKAQLYAYFGSKEALFDSIFAASLERILDVVPIDSDDLADWAVRLYDEYLLRPDLIRLATWHRLERRRAGHLVEDDERLDAGKLAAIAAAQRSGSVVAGDPFDVMALVIALSMAWSPVSNVYAATADEPGAVHQQRRELLRRAVLESLGESSPLTVVSARHVSRALDDLLDSGQRITRALLGAGEEGHPAGRAADGHGGAEGWALDASAPRLE